MNIAQANAKTALAIQLHLPMFLSLCVADLHHFNANLDPTFHSEADPSKKEYGSLTGFN
jgi:hypothetical protein